MAAVALTGAAAPAADAAWKRTETVRPAGLELRMVGCADKSKRSWHWTGRMRFADGMRVWVRWHERLTGEPTQLYGVKARFSGSPLGAEDDRQLASGLRRELRKATVVLHQLGPDDGRVTYDVDGTYVTSPFKPKRVRKCTPITPFKS